MPEQFVRVLVSTASPHVIVPLSEAACSPAMYNNSQAPPDCAMSRGNLFNLDDSSTSVDGGTYEINNNGVGLGGTLGYKQQVQFTLDTLGLGLNGPSLANQSIAGMNTHTPFYQLVSLARPSGLLIQVPNDGCSFFF